MLNVKDLVAGDRVILHCPTAANTPRPARYDGLFRSLQDAMVQKDAILLTGAPRSFSPAPGCGPVSPCSAAPVLREAYRSRSIQTAPCTTKKARRSSSRNGCNRQG